jgi:serine/threonine protein kinase
VKLIEASYCKEGDSLYMNILCELCESGTLFDLLAKYNGKLSEPQILFVMKEVTS